MKILFRSLYRFGDYILLLKKIFTTPDRWSEFLRRFKDEAYMLVIGSIAIVVTISLFIGAVITIQTQLNVSSPLLPAYTVGLVTRDTLLLEFSSSIMCLLLAGKIGSNIASEIGTMRVTEQIGVNSANYLILPKIAAMVVFIPVLVVFSMFSGLFGGYIVSTFTDIIPASRYIYGLQSYFTEYYVWYTIIKSFFFAFVISSVASYFGYRVKGGALEVGKASTDSVVVSSVMILLLDVILTKLLLQ